MRQLRSANREGRGAALLACPLLFVLSTLCSTFTGGPAFAGSMEPLGETADQPQLHNIAPLNPAPGQPAQPVLFPPTPAGWPGEMRDPRDTAPYLAFHKAEAMRRLQQVEQTREEPNPAEAYYDARYYDLNLSLNVASHVVNGIVTGKFTVVTGPLDPACSRSDHQHGGLGRDLRRTSR